MGHHHHEEETDPEEETEDHHETEEVPTTIAATTVTMEAVEAQEEEDQDGEEEITTIETEIISDVAHPIIPTIVGTAADPIETNLAGSCPPTIFGVLHRATIFATRIPTTLLLLQEDEDAAVVPEATRPEAVPSVGRGAIQDFAATVDPVVVGPGRFPGAATSEPGAPMIIATGVDDASTIAGDVVGVTVDRRRPRDPPSLPAVLPPRLPATIAIGTATTTWHPTRIVLPRIRGPFLSIS